MNTCKSYEQNESLDCTRQRASFLWVVISLLMNLVAIETLHAAWRKIRRIPISAKTFDERPHDSPRQNRAEKQR